MVTNHHYPGWQPDDISKSEKLKNNEEKKRLLYVALSRPTNKLIVTYHLQGGERHTYNTELYDEIAKCIDVFSYKG
jgi:ATP-dependent exoDNAse (exonuclease V) beta subunit